GTMLGASAEIVIADAVARDVPGAGGDLAWPLLRSAAMDATSPPGGRGGRGNVEDYMTLGYVPSDHGRSVSLTTEFAHDDFARAARPRTATRCSRVATAGKSSTIRAPAFCARAAATARSRQPRSIRRRRSTTTPRRTRGSRCG